MADTEAFSFPAVQEAVLQQEQVRPSTPDRLWLLQCIFADLFGLLPVLHLQFTSLTLQNPLLAKARVVHSTSGSTSQPRQVGFCASTFRYCIQGRRTINEVVLDLTAGLSQVTNSPAATSKAGKVPLEAGCSQMDWLRRVSKRTKSPGALLPYQGYK